MSEWTPEEQAQHCRDLLSALDDIAWDPGWTDLAAQLLPDTPGWQERGRGVGFGWSARVYQQTPEIVSAPWE